MDWLGLLIVQDSQESSPTLQFKSSNSLVLSLLYSSTLTSIHDYWTRQTFVGKVTSLLFNMLASLLIAFLARGERLLTSWLQSLSLTVSIVSSSICHEVMGLDAMILVFLMLSYKPTFSFCSFTFIKRLDRKSVV